jgi:hypothetical protein
LRRSRADRAGDTGRRKAELIGLPEVSGGLSDSRRAGGFFVPGGKPTLQSVAAEADGREADREATFLRKGPRGRVRSGMAALACAVAIVTGSPAIGEQLDPGRTADLWQVTGLEPGSRLNIRAKPSTEGRILARLDEHAVVRKLGCIDVDDTTWCKVETRVGTRASGWLDARYLAEASFTGSTPTARAVAGTYDALGSIDCMFEGNDTLRACRSAWCGPATGRP